MKSTHLALALLLAQMVLGPSPGFAASLPNFSGTWVVDKSESAVHSTRSYASLVADGFLTLVIDHHDPALKIVQHASLMMIKRTVVLTYYTDGRESTNRNARGATMTSRSHWADGTLLTDLRIVRGSGANAEVVMRRDVMSLAEDGNHLVIESTQQQPGQDKPESVRLVFTRRQ